MVTPHFTKLFEKARRVQLVLTDCDGVLTDGGVYFGATGEMLKRFNIRDGMGVERLRRLAGIETGIVTGETSPSVVERARKLKIDILKLGISKKSETIAEILREARLAPSQVAYIGDDVNDLEVLAEVGLSASPADGMAEVLRMVDFVCTKNGGHGAFREFSELILSAKLSNSIQGENHE